MYPKHLTEERRIVLRVPTRLDVARPLIIAVSAVTGCDVKIVIVVRTRTESDPATVVIGLRLIECEHDLDVRRRRVGDVRVR